MVKLAHLAQGHDGPILPELFHELLDLLRSVRFVQYIHEEEDDGCHKGHQNPHDAHIWPHSLANPQDFVDNPLELGHVTLLHQLVLVHSLFNLLLREVYVVWEKLEEFLADLVLPFFLLLEFQVAHVNPRVKLSGDAIQEDVYADVQRMLQHIFKSADAATQMVLLEDACQEAMAAESVTTLQSHRFDEHLQANGARELLAQQFLLNFAHKCRVLTVAVGRPINPLIHRPIDSGIYRRIGIRTLSLAFHLHLFALPFVHLLLLMATTI